MIEWLNKVFGLHDVASVHGHEVDHLLGLVHWFMLVLFVFWTAFLITVIWRFRRKKNPKASYAGMTSHFSTHLEIGVIIVEVVLLMGFAFPLWAKRSERNLRPTGDNVVNIRAVAEQFRWTFHYAGADKKLGLTSYERINAGSNTLGLVAEDPNAADDFVSINQLILPKGRPVVIQVTSKDVVHGLYIEPMFVQQDAVPGAEIPMWFIPEKTGEWNIVCAQLCGTGHATMVSYVEVKEAKDFDQWYQSQQPYLPKKQLP